MTIMVFSDVASFSRTFSTMSTPESPFPNTVCNHLRRCNRSRLTISLTEMRDLFFGRPAMKRKSGVVTAPSGWLVGYGIGRIFGSELVRVAPKILFAGQ
jgi:hypothetical protein